MPDSIWVAKLAVENGAGSLWVQGFAVIAAQKTFALTLILLLASAISMTAVFLRLDEVLSVNDPFTTNVCCWCYEHNQPQGFCHASSAVLENNSESHAQEHPFQCIPETVAW
jgi:hypothetical protein